jgi:predicted nicotinamide N-methyase
LTFAADNAKLNNFKSYETLAIDWRSPPANRKFPVILGADLIYETVKHEPLLNVIRHLLAPGGVALLTDPDRISCDAFRDTLKESEFQWSMEFIRAGEPGGQRYKGTLYWLQLP